jgi:hypothetical protein
VRQHVICVKCLCVPRRCPLYNITHQHQALQLSRTNDVRADVHKVMLLERTANRVHDVLCHVSCSLTYLWLPVNKSAPFKRAYNPHPPGTSSSWAGRLCAKMAFSMAWAAWQLRVFVFHARQYSRAVRTSSSLICST